MTCFTIPCERLNESDNEWAKYIFWQTFSYRFFVKYRHRIRISAHSHHFWMVVKNHSPIHFTSVQKRVYIPIRDTQLSYQFNLTLWLTKPAIKKSTLGHTSVWQQCGAWWDASLHFCFKYLANYDEQHATLWQVRMLP